MTQRTETIDQKFDAAFDRARSDVVELETAEERLAHAVSSGGRVATYFARRSVAKHERAVADSSEHLGMIEDLRAMLTADGRVEPAPQPVPELPPSDLL